MPHYRIEIKLNTSKEFRVVRFIRDLTLDEYFLDTQSKARKEYGDSIVSFDVVQLSRYSQELSKKQRAQDEKIIIKSGGRKTTIINDPT